MTEIQQQQHSEIVAARQGELATNWKGVNARSPHPPHFRSRQFRAGRAYVAAGGQFKRHLTAADRDQTAVSVIFHFMKPAVPCRDMVGQLDRAEGR
jgi:hypothetical protein